MAYAAAAQAPLLLRCPFVYDVPTSWDAY